MGRFEEAARVGGRPARGDTFAFNKDFLAWVRAEMSAGKTVHQAAAEYAIPATCAGYTPNPGQTKTNISAIYDELTKK